MFYIDHWRRSTQKYCLVKIGITNFFDESGDYLGSASRRNITAWWAAVNGLKTLTSLTPAYKLTLVGQNHQVL